MIYIIIKMLDIVDFYGILKGGFSLEDLIRRELNQIKELEQRKVLKGILERILIPFYEVNQQMYKELEENIKQEIVSEGRKCDIFCTLVKRKDFPLFSKEFSPILKEDLEEPVYEWGEDGLLKGARVFLGCDYGKIKEITREGKVFSGTIKKGENIYSAQFQMKLCEGYREELEHLYQLFLQNNISWKTVFAPYIFKMAEIFLVKVEGLEEISEITQIHIDFKEYGKYIHDHVFPIWNIKKHKVGSVGFAMPCEDHKTYKHLLSIEGFPEEDSYFVENTHYEMQNIQKEHTKFYITCNTDEVQEWNIYQICEIEKGKNMRSFVYPVFHNGQKESFAENLARKNQVVVRTKAELLRLIQSFDCEEYLEFEGYEIRKKNKKENDSYCMNPFLLNEIRHQDMEQVFVLIMRAKRKGDYFIWDVLSFLVSEIQLRLPEYECIGEIV